MPTTTPGLFREVTDSPAAAPEAPGRGLRPAPVRPSPKRSQWGWAAVFLLPSLVPLLIFTVTPMFVSMWVSLHHWNLISPMKWAGLGNYQDLLTDPRTAAIFGHTLYYIAGYLPLVFAGGLGLAVLLNRALPARAFFRAAYFLPVVTSWVVVALVWKWLLAPNNGLVNWLLGMVGIDGPGWWTDPAWAMPSIILASVWKDLGFIMVILLAGLQAIPADLLEAATIDGANVWQRFWRVTFPLLTPSIFFVAVISLINGFQVFDQVYVMTEGGPGGATQVIVGQIQALTFRYWKAGDAAALSWLLFLVIFAVTIIQVRGQKRWVTHA